MTEEEFLEDVKNHELQVQYDDGINRTLRFQDSNNHYVHHFMLTTWDRHLCISGNCATYVFYGCEDMFRFFRRDDLTLNPDYWRGKLKSRAGDILEFKHELLRKFLLERLNSWEANSPEEKQAMWEDMELDILDFAHSTKAALEEINNFQSKCTFLDYVLPEHFSEYNDEFIWSLYAIVWGIQQYDSKKKENEDLTNHLEKVLSDIRERQIAEIVRRIRYDY